MSKDRNVDIIHDLDGHRIVVIHDIRFKGKRHINWNEVEEYLKDYVGREYVIESTDDLVYIGADLPDEYTGSEDTFALRGTAAKAKANAAQGLPEIIRIASNGRFSRNKSVKHRENAKCGWYRYNIRFALPVYDEKGDVSRYNVFCAVLLLRCAADGKMYMYDLINVKKEKSEENLI